MPRLVLHPRRHLTRVRLAQGPQRGHDADAREADGGAPGETLEVGRDGQASELLAVPSQQRETAEVALVLDQRSRMADV